MCYDASMKTCSLCKQGLPATKEFFAACKKHKDGLHYYCKKCTVVYRRNWYIKNAERLKKYSSEYHYANRDVCIAASKKRYSENRTERLANEAARYKSDPEMRARKIKAAAAWGAANPERIKVHRRTSHQRHPLTKRKNSARRRARLRKARTEPVHPQNVWEKTGGKCIYCEAHIIIGEMHMDHAIPLSRGGSHNLENLVPSCAPCNLRKFNKTAEEFLALIAVGA